jgi:hypothetical protein
LLIASAEAFAGGTPQHDDMTVVVLLAIQTSKAHRVSRLGERVGRPSASALDSYRRTDMTLDARCPPESTTDRVLYASVARRTLRIDLIDGPAARLTAWVLGEAFVQLIGPGRTHLHDVGLQ